MEMHMYFNVFFSNKSDELRLLIEKKFTRQKQYIYKKILVQFYQSKKGSSLGFIAGLSVSESG